MFFENVAVTANECEELVNQRSSAAQIYNIKPEIFCKLDSQKHSENSEKVRPVSEHLRSLVVSISLL